MRRFVIDMTEKLRIGSRHHYKFISADSQEEAEKIAREKYPTYWLNRSWEHKQTTFSSGAY